MTMRRTTAAILAALAGAAALGAGCGSDDPKSSAGKPQDKPVQKTQTPVPRQGQKAADKAADSADAVKIAEVVPAKLSEEPVLNTFKHPSGLVIEELRVGDGDVVLPGAVITFRHRAFRADTKEQFEESYSAQSAPEVPLTRAMRGLRDGVPGMRVGGKRRLLIPSSMAFGFMGRPAPGSPTGLGAEITEYLVPPNTDIIYELELKSVKQQYTAPRGPVEMNK